MHRFALGLVLAMSAAGPTAANDAAKASAPEDRYLWLEDVTGEKALDWARARNAESAKVLETGDFAALEKRILDILERFGAASAHPHLVGDPVGPGTTTSGAMRRTPAACGGARPSPSTARTSPPGRR